MLFFFAKSHKIGVLRVVKASQFAPKKQTKTRKTVNKIYKYQYMEVCGAFMRNLRKKLRKKQKNFIYPLAFLSGLRYNKDTKVVKSGAKNQQSGEKWWKI